MKITDPLKDPVCVFREGDNEDNCTDCARIKQTTIPKGRQSWQYAPKVAEGQKCPSYFTVEKNLLTVAVDIAVVSNVILITTIQGMTAND